jgi:uroporphyrinogen decarboxylase
MTEQQWQQLLDVIEGEEVNPLPIGFIIDSPWLPNWYGVEIIDYFASETIWFEANQRAIETFPNVWFFPGFWAEFGMCTEPSAFGAKCIFPPNEFPFPKNTLKDVSQIDDLELPDPATDGLLPFVLKRLTHAKPKIEALGHKIRFSISRGPLNIASFLMGTTEFMIALKTDPDKMHKLLELVTEFLCRWHRLQKDTFPSIDGIMILDDLVGMLSEEDFKEFGLPYLKRVFSSFEARVKLFHNDASCAQSVKYYPEIGINLLNPGFKETLNQLKTATNNTITVMGNIPPRDVLAAGTPEDVKMATLKMLNSVSDHRRLIVSCGGGMPPSAPTENIRAMIDAVNEFCATRA